MNCPKCGKEFEGDSGTCPNCGSKPKKKKISLRAKTITFVFCIIFVIFVIPFTYATFNYSNSSPENVLKSYILACKKDDTKNMVKFFPEIKIQYKHLYSDFSDYDIYYGKDWFDKLKFEHTVTTADAIHSSYYFPDYTRVTASIDGHEIVSSQAKQNEDGTWYLLDLTFRGDPTPEIKYNKK